MGEVAMRIRLMPEGPEIDLSTVEEDVRGRVSENGGEVQVVEVKPFAFGLNAMEIAVTMPDKGSNPDAMEEALAEIEGIQGVEVLEVGLL
jgi:translation elongation factor aEF-1 beta